MSVKRPSFFAQLLARLKQFFTGLSHSPTSRNPPTLPEAESASSDWETRDVLVGALRSREQLGICLKHRFYHLPADQLEGLSVPIRYVAIYQSRRFFGGHAGIEYYGQVTGCSSVRRIDITEVMPRPGTESDPYYRLEVSGWKRLPRPIAAKELGFITTLTTLFLLEHSTEVPELFLQSQREYQLYTALKRAVHHPSVNRRDYTFECSFEDVTVTGREGQLILSRKGQRLAQCEIAEFTRRPGASFNRLWNRIETHA